MPKIEALVCKTGDVIFCLRDLLLLHQRVITLLNSGCV